jgi:hypothetical protein
MFAQVDTSLERSRDGLGIGLTLVRTLVEMHGGTVQVHSEGLGRGSEFTIRLPIAAATARPSSQPAVREPLPPSVGRRILIVDDSEDGAESLAMLLQLEGHANLQGARRSGSDRRRRSASVRMPCCSTSVCRS